MAQTDRVRLRWSAWLLPANAALAVANKRHQMARVIRWYPGRWYLGLNSRQRLFQLQSGPIENFIGLFQRIDSLAGKSGAAQPHQVQPFGGDVEIRIHEKWRGIAIHSHVARDHGEP